MKKERSELMYLNDSDFNTLILNSTKYTIKSHSKKSKEIVDIILNNNIFLTKNTKRLLLEEINRIDPREKINGDLNSWKKIKDFLERDEKYGD